MDLGQLGAGEVRGHVAHREDLGSRRVNSFVLVDVTTFVLFWAMYKAGEGDIIRISQLPPFVLVLMLDCK